MIYLRMVRIGFCEICTANFYITAAEIIPSECPVCRSTEWEWGPEPLDGIKIRMRIEKASRKINPGVKSLKRQERARNQFRDLKPKPIESDTQAGEN